MQIGRPHVRKDAWQNNAPRNQSTVLQNVAQNKSGRSTKKCGERHRFCDEIDGFRRAETMIIGQEE